MCPPHSGSQGPGDSDLESTNNDLILFYQFLSLLDLLRNNQYQTEHVKYDSAVAVNCMCRSSTKDSGP